MFFVPLTIDYRIGRCLNIISYLCTDLRLSTYMFLIHAGFGLNDDQSNIYEGTRASTEVG